MAIATTVLIRQARGRRARKRRGRVVRAWRGDKWDGKEGRKQKVSKPNTLIISQINLSLPSVSK